MKESPELRKLNRRTYAAIRVKATALVQANPDQTERRLVARLARAYPDVFASVLGRSIRKALRIARGEKPRTSGSPPNFCVVATPEELEFIRREGKMLGSKAGVFHRAIRLYRSVLARPELQEWMHHVFDE